MLFYDCLAVLHLAVLIAAQLSKNVRAIEADHICRRCVFNTATARLLLHSLLQADGNDVGLGDVESLVVLGGLEAGDLVVVAVGEVDVALNGKAEQLHIGLHGLGDSHVLVELLLDVVRRLDASADLRGVGLAHRELLGLHHVDEVLGGDEPPVGGVPAVLEEVQALAQPLLKVRRGHALDDGNLATS